MFSFFNPFKGMFTKGEVKVSGNKVYVGNLAWGATEDDLRETFAKFGTVTEARIVTDRETGRSKGFAFVTFETSTAADSAVDGMYEQSIAGRPVKVSIAVDRPREARGGYSQDRRGGYKDNSRY